MTITLKRVSNWIQISKIAMVYFCLFVICLCCFYLRFEMPYMLSPLSGWRYLAAPLLFCLIPIHTFEFRRNLLVGSLIAIVLKVCHQSNIAPTIIEPILILVIHQFSSSPENYPVHVNIFEECGGCVKYAVLSLSCIPSVLRYKFKILLIDNSKKALIQGNFNYICFHRLFLDGYNLQKKVIEF